MSFVHNNRTEDSFNDRPVTPTAAVVASPRTPPPLPARRRPVPILRLEDDAPLFPVHFGRRPPPGLAPRLAPRRGALVDPSVLASGGELLAFFHQQPPPVPQDSIEEEPEILTTPSPVRRFPILNDPPVIAVGVTLHGLSSHMGGNTKIPYLDVIEEEEKKDEDGTKVDKTTVSFHTDGSSAFHQVKTDQDLHNKTPLCDVLKMKTNIEELKETFSSLIIHEEEFTDPCDSTDGE